MEKKTKNIIFAVVAVLLLVLAAVLIFLFINPKKTNKELLTEHLEKSVSGIKELTTKENNFVSNVLVDENTVIRVYSDTDLTVEEDGEEYVYEFEGEGYTKGIEELYGKLFLAEDSETVIDIEAVLKDSKVYHKLNNVYSNFYYEEIDMTEIKEALESEELELDIEFDATVFVDYFLEVIDEQLEDEMIEKEEKEIKLGGEKRKVDKITANFTEKDLLKMLKNYVQKLNNNKQLKDLLDELVEQEIIDEAVLEEFDIDELIDEIDSMIDEADDKKNLFKYSIYLDDNDVVSNEFVISVESDEQDVNIKFVINSFENKDGNKVEEVYLSLMGIKMVTLEVEYENEDEYNIELSVYSMFDIEGTVKEKSKSFEAEFTGNMTVYDDEGNDKKEEFFNITIDAKELEANQKYGLDVDLSVDYDGVELDLDSKNKFSINEKMPKIDLSDAKEKSEMTAKELEAYEEIFGESYDYDDDYDYDFDEDYDFELDY